MSLCGTYDDKQTTEDRATQPIEAEFLNFRFSLGIMITGAGR